MGVFLLSYNSRSFEDFAGSSCKLKPYGGLILLLRSSACLFLIYVIACMLNYISHHISSRISNSSFYMSNACMNYKILGEISMILLLKCAMLQKKIPHYAHLQGGVLLYLAIKFLNISIYTSYVYPRWKLNLYCHQSPKRGRLEVHLVPLSDFGVLKTYRLRD